ncbi:Protein OCTOPUS [Linum grandiflorum]
MNPSAATATTTATDPQQLHPPQPPQPHRPSTSCPRHPEEDNFTGFCPSCLCERLAILDHSSSAAATTSSSSSRKPLLASAALRAIFKPSTNSSNSSNINNNNKPSFFPELRRSKSFSASKNEGFSGVFEPQRKSCDVRGRNTLWLLFNQGDNNNNNNHHHPVEIEQQPPRVSASGSLRSSVLKPREEEQDGFESTESQEDEFEEEEEGNVGGNTDIVVEPSILTARNSNAKPIEEIIEEEDEHEEEEEEEEEEEIAIEAVEEEKTMKDHIDLDSSQTKKRVSFWSAASVFSKKLQKWRQKQKLKKRRSNGGVGGVSVSGTLPVEKPIGRQYRETQSEIADYGFGRRSCDTDPRFSLDIGRMSFDDPRYSFDEPRASWDGYLMGRTFPTRATLLPTMLSVVEDAPVVIRSDAHIPVEQPPPPPQPPAAAAVPTIHSVTEDEFVPGGCAQTRDYYTDSSTRRRKSLDRSSSIRSTAAAVVAEIDELKSVSSNSKVSPATVESSAINGPKVDYLREYSHYSNSLRDDCSVETLETGFRDNASIVGGGGGDRKENGGGAKKSKRWGKGWSIWGFIHRRSVNKDDDRSSSYRGVGNGVERSFSETWPDLRGERMINVSNGGRSVSGFSNPTLMRSNSSVSWRNNSNGFGVGGSNANGFGSFGSGRKSNVETCSSGNGFGGGRKKRDEFMLERNRSARYSPSNSIVDNNGMLKWYLAPQTGTGRSTTGGGGGWGKSKTHQAHSIARSVLRLY